MQCLVAYNPSSVNLYSKRQNEEAEKKKKAQKFKKKREPLAQLTQAEMNRAAEIINKWAKMFTQRNIYLQNRKRYQILFKFDIKVEYKPG